jgi:hypothetical protein
MAIPTEKQKIARKRNWAKRVIMGMRSQIGYRFYDQEIFTQLERSRIK